MANPSPTTKRLAAAFSLLESMVASLILSLAVAAFSVAMTASTRHDAYTQQQALATMLGRQLLEEVAAMPVDVVEIADMAAAPAADAGDGGLPDDPFDDPFGDQFGAPFGDPFGGGDDEEELGTLGLGGNVADGPSLVADFDGFFDQIEALNHSSRVRGTFQRSVRVLPLDSGPWLKGAPAFAMVEVTVKMPDGRENVLRRPVSVRVKAEPQTEAAE